MSLRSLGEDAVDAGTAGSRRRMTMPLSWGGCRCWGDGIRCGWDCCLGDDFIGGAVLVEGRMLSPWDGFRRGGRGVLIEGRMLRWRRMLVEGRVWSPGGGGAEGRMPQLVARRMP